MKELIITMLIFTIVLAISRIVYEKGKELGCQEFMDQSKEIQEVQKEVNAQLDRAHEIVRQAEEYKKEVIK